MKAFLEEIGLKFLADILIQKRIILGLATYFTAGNKKYVRGHSAVA